MTNIPVRNKPPAITSVVVFLDGTVADVTKTKLQVDKEMLRKMRDNINKQFGEQ